jgi:K+-sensing histidine kinase KdpD
MIATVGRILDRWSERAIILWAALALLVVALADYLTPPIISWTLLYLLPIFLVSWGAGRMAGLIASIVTATVWLSHDFVVASAGEFWSAAWNNAMKIGVFVTFAIVISRVKYDIDEQTRLNNDLSSALAQVNQLSGLLPICAWCKRIREKGGWHQLERYIMDHSEADFSHGICPDCAASRKLEARK